MFVILFVTACICVYVFVSCCWPLQDQLDEIQEQWDAHVHARQKNVNVSKSLYHVYKDASSQPKNKPSQVYLLHLVLSTVHLV